MFHYNTSSLLTLRNTDDRRLELPGTNLAFEQDVTFAISAVLQLREAEVGADPTDASSTCPDVTAFASEIPSGGVEHLRGQINHRDLRDIVSGTTNTGAQSPKADGRGLGNDGVWNRSKGTGKNEGDYDSKAGLGIIGRRILLNRSTDAENDQQNDVGSCTPKINCSTAEPWRNKPRADIGHESQTGVDQAKLERTIWGDSSF